MHDQQRLARLVRESHRGDSAVLTLCVGPDEAPVRCHIHVSAKERDRLRTFATELETVPAPWTNIHLAGEQRHAGRLWGPPALKKLGLSPRLKHRVRRP